MAAVEDRAQRTAPLRSPPQPAGRLLVVDGGPGAGSFVAVDPDGTVVGRDGTCGLVLASGHVSRAHAVVEGRDGGCTVRDLGSANGTFLNGQPVTAPTPLHDGDRLRFADVTVEFLLSEAPPQPARPSHGWDPQVPTDRMGPQDGSTGRRRRLRDDVHGARGFSGGGLLLAVLGSVVGTVLSSAGGTNQWGTLAAAAVGPVVSAAFSTKGGHGKARTIAVVVLSAAALAITVTGVSLADLAAGHSVLPGREEIRGTFPTMSGPPEPPSTGSSGAPDIEVEPTELSCGSLPVGGRRVCAEVIVSSTGEAPLHVTGVEVPGDAFSAEGCEDATIAPGDACVLTVSFHPSARGDHDATVVVHQNLPRPDRGTPVAVSGRATAEGTVPIDEVLTVPGAGRAEVVDG